MACFRPITGYRSHGGKVKFSSKEGFIDRPVTIACGQCMGCRLERSRQWAVRCIHEAQCHTQNCFVTLTYDDEHLPVDRGLDLAHWQVFAKALRKKMGPFRYFHCGEYGDTFGRPHYHACLFGIDFSADRRVWRVKQGNKLYSSPTLEKLWRMGFAVIGEMNFETAAYVARYVLKKVTGEPADAHYGGRKPEYTTMSRRPGIGSKWVEKYGDEVYRGDFCVVNGKKVRPPKFYDSRLEFLNPSEYARIKGDRASAARKHEDNNTWERLAIREKVTEAKLELMKREVG